MVNCFAAGHAVTTLGKGTISVIFTSQMKKMPITRHGFEECRIQKLDTLFYKEVNLFSCINFLLLAGLHFPLKLFSLQFT